MSRDKTDVLRLRRKHAPKVTREITARDGERLVRSQSLPGAIIAGIVAIAVFSMLWTMLSAIVGELYPWLTLLLGLFIGLVVRRAGHGIDWRFPLTAALLAVLGAVVGNVVVAASFTAAEFEAGTLQVLGSVTSMTWPVFFAEMMTPADLVYALFAAAIAAFFANRRLSRAEYLALRRWEAER